MRRAAILFAVFAGPALAADRPPTIPLHDVDVTYQMAQPQEGGPALHQRMRWSVSTNRLRVDPPSPGLYMIIDYTAKRMSVVKLADRAVLDMPTAAPGLPGAPAGLYAKRGPVSRRGLAVHELADDRRRRPGHLAVHDAGRRYVAGEPKRTSPA